MALQPKRKSAGLTARAGVAGDPRERRAALPTGSRGTRERGGVGPRHPLPTQKSHRSSVCWCPSGGRGSGTGPRMSEARGKWKKKHPPEFAFEKI